MDADHLYEQLVAHRVDDVMRWAKIASQDQPTANRIRSLISDPVFKLEPSSEELVWFAAPGGPTATNAAQSLVRSNARYHLEPLAKQLMGSWSSDQTANAASVYRWIHEQRPALPTAVEVNGIREISAGNEEAPDLNGLSIKRRLSQLQNPTTERLEDKKRFYAIQQFVRVVLEDETLTIDVPHDLSTIHVTQAGQTLPIEYVGTGIHEVVIMAAAATVTQNSIMCIEEPEVHLHPILQRKLLRYLSAKTNNQYFIATHSAHMLDSNLGSIFHVTRQNSRSSIRYAGLAKDRSAICSDLGYRPSDLVQTNAVIWVEGPSDRIYLKHWIDKLAPGEFLEGTHYSMMFYGGALLSELSPLDAEEVDEFISLRALNRYVAIIIDSDKTNSRKKLNRSKTRVLEEMQSDQSGTSLAWVTRGYTIENYVPDILLSDAIHVAHPSTKGRDFSAITRWENPLSPERIGVKQPSKTAIAKEVVKNWGDDWPDDLKKRGSQIVDFIRAANSHS